MVEKGRENAVVVLVLWFYFQKPHQKGNTFAPGSLTLSMEIGQNISLAACVHSLFHPFFPVLSLRSWETFETRFKEIENLQVKQFLLFRESELGNKMTKIYTENREKMPGRKLKLKVKFVLVRSLFGWHIIPLKLVTNSHALEWVWDCILSF